MLRSIRIALGSDNGKNILSGHMGEAKEFYVYDLFENGEVRFLEKRANKSPEEKGKHGLSEKRMAIMGILSDTEVFVGNKMSPNFVKIACNTKCQPVVVKIDSIAGIMNAIVKSFNRVFTLVEQRKQGKYSREIPKIEDTDNTVELK